MKSIRLIHLLALVVLLTAVQTADAQQLFEGVAKFSSASTMPDGSVSSPTTST